MDCLQAQAVLSALHDGETVPDAEAHAARVHCVACRSCAAFTSALESLDRAETAPLPDGLHERIMEAVRGQAQAAEERVDPSPQTAALPAGPVVRTPRSPYAFWLRAGAGAAVAAAAVAIGIVAVQMHGAGVSTSTGTAPAERLSATATWGAAGAPKSASAQGYGQAAAPAASAQAPAFVSFQGSVYAPGTAVADSSTVGAAIGTLVSAFASTTDAPGSASVSRSSASDGSIVVRTPQGLQSFAPVVRTVNGLRYQLQTGTPIDRYGIWPTLPAGFATPTSPDGSPTFARASIDAAGVTVYARTGYPISQGVAVAPGTASSDPASGDPNWTWWAPVP